MASATVRCPGCGHGVPRDGFCQDVVAVRCPVCGHALHAPSPADRRLVVGVACGVAGGLVVGGLALAVALWKGTRPPGDEQAPSLVAAAAAGPSVLPDGTAAALEKSAPGEAPGPPLPGQNLAQAVPAADVSSAEAAQGDLCYRWKEGRQYSYRVSCKAEIGDTLLELTGRNTYTAGRPAASRPSATPPEGTKGSGTAFVVSADGYLLTCDHVVRGATDIKVTLGGETTPCDVVARDIAHDLAVLRVARQGLPVLPLADSEAVELAEEVRAVGFPLSDVLGSSVKVTRGSVAGIVAKRRGKVFQIDAVVNPGNSGGPLVDGRGAVVGVVNAQLVGLQISKVGFAVPINYAKALLAQHGIAVQTASGGATLEGPALAKQVTPAVALVTMMCHGDDASGQQRVALSYHGFLDRRRQPLATAAAPLAPPQVESTDRDDGRLIVDEYGEVSDFGGRVNLPCLLGPLGTVVIDPLPANDEKTWQRYEAVTITASRPGWDDPLAGLRPPGLWPPALRPPGWRGPRLRPPMGPFGDPYGGPFGEPRETDSRFAAVQKTTYTADEPSRGTVVIRKRLEMKTLDDTGPHPAVELTGSGQTVFDLKEGVPQKVTFSGTLVIRQGGRTEQVPVTLACELITGGEPLTGVAAPAPAAPAAPAPAVPAPAPTPAQIAESAKARLDGLLADLRATPRDWGKCFQALQTLSMMQPVEDRREEVAEVLDTHLAEKNYSARSSALRAVQFWGTRRNVPALLRLLRASESEAIRGRAMDVLGGLGDERAAAPIAQRLKDPADRASAARALRALGRAAEDPTIALLADPDPEVRDEACKVLGEIGGPKSIAALQATLAKGSADSTRAAKAALEKLQKKP